MNLDLTTLETQHLGDLVARMRDVPYQEAAINAHLGVYDIHQIRNGISQWHLRQAGQDTPLARLCAFWILGMAFPRSALEPLLGQETLSVLLKIGLIESTEDGLRARVHLFPCEGRYIFTDMMYGRGDNPRFQVYWLGGDSVSLARMAPRTPVDRALDLCTGSGVHAVLAGSHSQESWGVDVNPRALEFSRLNAMLNGLGSRCHFVQGDLYQPVEGKTFGLVTANPPFVPTPREDLALFRPGGATGEEVTARIVGGLPQHLEVGGTMALVSQCPVIRGSHALDRVERWLGGATGWGLGYLTFGVLEKDLVIAGHVKPLYQWTMELGRQEGEAAYRKEFDTWLASYEEVGIEATEFALTFVRRLAPDRPGWRAIARTSYPHQKLSPYVARWLDAHEYYSDGLADWSWRPAWSGTDRIMVDARNGEGLVFHEPMAWRAGGTELDADTAFLLERVDGRRTAEELLESFAERRGQSLDSLRPEVSRRLSELGRELLIA